MEILLNKIKRLLHAAGLLDFFLRSLHFFIYMEGGNYLTNSEKKGLVNFL